MGSSVLSEVDDTSILRTGLSNCYWRPLDWRPASRLLPPRSGLERSDVVLWSQETEKDVRSNVGYGGISGLVILTSSFVDPDPKRKSPSSPNERLTHSPLTFVDLMMGPAICLAPPGHSAV